MARDLKERSTSEVKAAWSLEIERRILEVDEGKVDLIDWEEVRAELFGEE
jgi:hypothetical protein